MHRQVGQIFPPPVFTGFTPNGSAQFNAGTHNFHYCDRGENESYLGTKITPESVAFIHKAHRSLLLFGSLFFCSAHIRERWCEMLTTSTATSTGHCLNKSSNFSGDFSTGGLWLDLLCYSQTPWQPCSRLHKQQHYWHSSWRTFRRHAEDRPQASTQGRGERYKPHKHLQEYSSSTKSSKIPLILGFEISFRGICM